MNILEETKLSFLHIWKYCRKNVEEFEFFNCPRPFFNIACVIDGEGHFKDSNGTELHLLPGDIFVIPNSTRYGGKWTGSPDITYITLHFIVEHNGSIFGNNAIEFQKIKGSSDLTARFIEAYQAYIGSDQEKYKAMADFYEIMYDLIPLLNVKHKRNDNTHIKRAIIYLTTNYKSKISVSTLCEIAHLSPSRFFTLFKRETGMSPIEYKNSVCIRNAEKLLISTDDSIEEISDELGFASAAYFRRLFKSYRGKTPTEYRRDLRRQMNL